MPGVVAIFTGKDIADDKVGGLICGWVVKDKDGQPHKAPPHPVMAVDTVRYVGDTVAMVVANSHDEAARRGRGDQGRLRGEAGHRRSRQGARQGRARGPSRGAGQPVYDWEIGEKADVDAAFAKAAHVTKLDLVNNRLIPNAMEPRAAVGRVRQGHRRLHALLDVAEPACAPADPVGLRAAASPSTSCASSRPMSAAASAPRSSATPKRRWSPGRRPASAGRSSGPPSAANRSCPTRMAATTSPMPSWRSTRTASSWRSRSTRSPTWAPISRPSRPRCRPISTRTLLAGQYTTPLIYANVKAAFTHTAPVDAYRGAGRPEATFVIERIVSKAAAETEDRSGRAAPEELHSVDRLPVPDAGGAAVRLGQLPADHRRGDEDRRLRGLRGAPRRGQVARQAARHRLLVLHRGLRHRAVARWSARSAAASACGSRRRSSSTRPATSRS